MEDAVESFTFSDDSDDEGMGTSSKNYEKSFSRGNDSKGGRKYADSDDGEDGEIYSELFERDRMANADAFDNTNVVPFSDEEDEDFESDGRLVVSRKHLQQQKPTRNGHGGYRLLLLQYQISMVHTIANNPLHLNNMLGSHLVKLPRSL